MKKNSTLADRYDANGYAVVEHIVSDLECDLLKKEARHVLREHADDNATVYVGAAAQSNVFRKLADDPRIIDVLRLLMPDGVMFLTDKIVFKSGEKTFATPWHIDAFYWVDTRPKLSVWIPLDDVSANNGTLKVVPASHLEQWSMDRNNRKDMGGEFGKLIKNETWDPADEVVCEIPRGSVVIFSDRLLHASCPNTACADRYTIISTYHAPAEDEPFDTKFPARHVVVPAAADT